MKKMLCVLLTVLLLLALASGCGAKSAPETRLSDTPGAGNPEMNFATAMDSNAPLENPSAPPASAQLRQAKLIYTANLELETTDFDAAGAALEELADKSGGYMEHSDVRDGADGYRYGDYTVRVPVEQFENFCTQAGTLCHMTGKSKSAENVSEVYYDVQSRLKTQQTKLERLQKLLAQAEKMEDIITIESAIGDTELALEQLAGSLRGYDALISFSTIHLSLREVYKLSNVTQTAIGFPARIGAALASGWGRFVDAAEALCLFVAYNWALLLIFAALGFGAVRLLARQRKRRAEKKEEKTIPPEKEG